MTNVLILTITLFVIFVAGIFVGRELTYLADGRKRRKERNRNQDILADDPPGEGALTVSDDVSNAEPYDEILDLHLIASYDPETGLYKGYDDVPPVAGGYIDDESKHWPKTR